MWSKPVSRKGLRGWGYYSGFSDLCNMGKKSGKRKAEIKIGAFLLLVVRLPCFLDQYVVFMQSCNLPTNWTKTTVVTVLWQAEAFPCSPQKQVLIKHQLRSHHLHTGQRGLCWTDNVNKHTTFLHLYKQRSKCNLVQQYDGRNRSILFLHPLGGWTRKACAPSTLGFCYTGSRVHLRVPFVKLLLACHKCPALL